MKMEGQVVRTIRDFLTTKDGELCVNRDEYLQVNLKYYIINVQQGKQISYIFPQLLLFHIEYFQVIRKIDRHWVKCKIESREGLIPSSHITEVENIPRLSKNQHIFVSTSDYSAEEEGQLYFRHGKNNIQWCSYI